MAAQAAADGQAAEDDASDGCQQDADDDADVLAGPATRWAALQEQAHLAHFAATISQQQQTGFTSAHRIIGSNGMYLALPNLIKTNFVAYGHAVEADLGAGAWEPLYE